MAPTFMAKKDEPWHVRRQTELQHSTQNHMGVSKNNGTPKMDGL